MSYEDDFVNEDIVSLNVDGYSEGSWKYKPTTAGEENEWLDQYMEFDVKSKTMKQNFAVLNKLKMSNILKVPYSVEELETITGISKEWNIRSVDEKWLLFKKMKSSVFDKILNAINAFDQSGKKEKN